MKPIHTESLPLFAPVSSRSERRPTATEVGLAARDRAASKHARDIERLIPIAQELAARAGASGVTVSDLRLAAVQRGILTGAETGRSLSYLGRVMLEAGLENTGTYRRSVMARSNGNLHAVWRLAA